VKSTVRLRVMRLEACVRFYGVVGSGEFEASPYVNFPSD